MPTYAEGTSVDTGRSRGEIERTLGRFGATAFGYLTERSRAVIMFEYAERRVRFTLPLPDRADPKFTRTPTGRAKSPSQAESAWEQACREQWRALALAVKAKLAAVETGIATFEDEFLAYIALPDGTTVGERVIPQIDHAYQTGTMPALMPGAN